MTDQTAGTGGHDPYALARTIALARRRAGLSERELAERAGMSVEHLHYLEDRPIEVPHETLIRLAAALGMTVETLLAPARHHVPGAGVAAVEHRMVDVPGDQARELLASGLVGRLALGPPDGPAILPVNYVVTEGDVALRTASDTPIARLRGTVAFEVDHLDDEHELAWSVLVVGEIEPVTDPAQVLRLEGAAHLRPWAGGERELWMRIRPARVTARRIVPADSSRPANGSDRRTWATPGDPGSG